MPDWSSLLRPPDDARSLDEWFGGVADVLLNGSLLVVGRQPHRLSEVEFYYWSKEHPDPFTHRDPIQFHTGLWYFHRTRGVYRSGSFKGLDLTFGDDSTSGGVLIRGIETAGGALIDGPSLCVDHLLDATGADTVDALDRAINSRPFWEEGNPLLLRQTDDLERRPVVPSPRVGLLLKRVRSREESTRYVMRSYRYLSEPRRTKKGKAHVVLALHAGGEEVDDIHRRTNCPRRTIERYVADFETGRAEANFTPYFGIDLGPREWCKLYGVWCAHFRE